MFNNRVNGKPEFKNLGRHTADYRVRRATLGNHRPSSNHRATTYGYAFKDCNVTASPNIILNSYGSVVFRQFIVTVHYEFSDNIRSVVASYDCRMWTEYHFPPYCQRCLGAIKRAAFRNTASITNRHVPQALKVARHRSQINVLTTLLHTAFIKR